MREFKNTVDLRLTIPHKDLLRQLVKKRMEKIIQLEDPQCEKELDMLQDIAVALAAAD